MPATTVEVTNAKSAIYKARENLAFVARLLADVGDTTDTQIADELAATHEADGRTLAESLDTIRDVTGASL